MYIQVPDVGGYLGKEGDRIMFGAMWFLNVKIAISAPYVDRLGDSFQRDFYQCVTASLLYIHP